MREETDQESLQWMLAKLKAIAAREHVSQEQLTQMLSRALQQAPLPSGFTPTATTALAPPPKASGAPGIASSSGIRDLDRYLLLAELGRGGMGVVYHARDRHLGRDVAMKILPSTEWLSEEQVQRFEREARVVAAFDHPNIVKLFDVGTLPSEGGGTTPFYTMELLEGEDLSRAIASGTVSPRQAVDITRQIALALAYAHEKGVLHRDVKPGNIFLRRHHLSSQVAPGDESISTLRLDAGANTEISALLVDFGLAKHLAGEGEGREARRREGRSPQALTVQGQILGTPVYMSPEQVAGASDIDQRSDVYSLGATLYHLLTGLPPFYAPTLTALLEMVRRDDPVPPRRRVHGLSREIETICLKCLAKERGARYASALDLAEDCRRYLSGEPVRARPRGRFRRGVRWARRHPLLALGVAVVFFFVSAIGFRLLGPRRLTIVTDPPHATVTLNGRPIGTGRWLWPIGSILVRVEADGFTPQEFLAEVPLAGYCDLGHVTLLPDHGYLSLESDPPGAEVWLDGRSLGEAPLSRYRVPVGLHALEIRVSDAPPREKVILVHPGGVLDLGLIPLPRR